MNQDIIFGVIGGLGLFVFGMHLLSDGLQQVASTRLRKIIVMFTDKPLIGIFSGCLLTAIIQSSSATTVMTIGFVNSGMMLLRQAIGVIIGANIGTTMTAQIIAFKISAYALPTIGIGTGLYIFGKKKKTRYWGEVLLGLGILFLGLTIMGDVMKSLKDSPVASEFFIKLSKNPFLGVFVGTLVTVLIQSSSASIGLVIALASNGLIDLQGAIYLVLGDNIGTTITAWLASIGTNFTSKRVAMAHSTFNIIGAVYFVFLTSSGWYIDLIDYITPGEINVNTISRHIANAHTMFNIMNAAVFFPLIPALEWFVKKIIPGKEPIKIEPHFLEPHLLDNPEIALSQAKKEMHVMLKLAKDTVVKASDAFFTTDRKLLKDIPKMEDSIDNLQGEITSYLVDISKNTLTPEQSEQLPLLLHSVNDIEKIGDHAENIMRVTERVIDEKLQFSASGLSQIKSIYDDMIQMFDILLVSFENTDESSVKNLFKIESNLNTSYKLMGKEQIQHLQRGKNFVLSGIAFLDLINNMEKIGDHLTNIAEAVTNDFRYPEYSKKAV